MSSPTSGESNWVDNNGSGSSVDLDQMTKTLTTIKSKNMRPDLLSSVISHYASKWLPDLIASPAGPTAILKKKRLFVETLIDLLPPDKLEEPIMAPCDLLLKLLRAASMVRAGPTYLADLETRVALRLDGASIAELTIPAFGYECRTLLDFGLVLRLVKRFMGIDEVARSGAATVKVAKLVDSYLAEAAADSGLAVSDFEKMATAVPGHARVSDDGLYRAVDTYIKAHPGLAKQERKALCRLIDMQKLTPDASLHAIHNDRIPIRSVIQVLFSEQSKLSRITNGSGASFNLLRSPNLSSELSGRCLSKREVLVQQQDMQNLREDVARLRAQCRHLQGQIDRLAPERKKRGFLKWSGFLFRNDDSVDKFADDYHEARTPRTPMDSKKTRAGYGKGTPQRWRRDSLS